MTTPLFYLKKIVCLWLCWVFLLSGLFSNCGERGLLFVALYRLLIMVRFLVVAQALGRGLESLQLMGPQDLWDLLGPRIE